MGGARLVTVSLIIARGTPSPIYEDTAGHVTTIPHTTGVGTTSIAAPCTHRYASAATTTERVAPQTAGDIT